MDLEKAQKQIGASLFNDRLRRIWLSIPAFVESSELDVN